MLKHKGILRFVKIDSYNIEVDIHQSKNELITFLREKNVLFDMPTESAIMIKSNLLSLDVEFYIYFHFDSERIVAITMSPDKALQEEEMFSRYEIIQKALEVKLGIPENAMRLIMRIVDPHSRFSRWNKEGICIEHYIIDRFGLEDIISIKL